MAEVVVSTGDDVRVRVGDLVELRLPEPGVTGHQWSTRTLGEGLLLETDDAEARTDQAPGAAGAHVWVLRAARPGTWTIEVVLARPWETDVARERRVVVTVE